MIVFTVIGMCILASFIGLAFYKLSELEEENNRIDRSDYYGSYEEPEVHQIDALESIAMIEDSWEEEEMMARVNCYKCNNEVYQICMCNPAVNDKEAQA